MKHCIIATTSFQGQLKITFLDKFLVKICPCGNGIEVSTHLLFNCNMINAEKRNAILQILMNNQYHPISSISDQKNLLLSWSRVPGFTEVCCSAINDISGHLLMEISICVYSLTTPNGVSCLLPNKAKDLLSWVYRLIYPRRRMYYVNMTM